MRYVSLFSGIEAASVAWGPLGWEPVAFAEIEPFPCAVLAERFPGVPNLGDVRSIDWKEFLESHGAVDLVGGGSPCQSFSVAGRREGLRGESGLMFEYIRAVRELRPEWFVWENVPGALSSERGEAFRQLLSEMDALGYGMAWRVLDAQFFGVPQRRERVFLVGCLGDVERACQVLFEPEMLRGDLPSSRVKRQELAADAAGGAGRAAGSLGFNSNKNRTARSMGEAPEQSPTLTADAHQPAVAYPWSAAGKAAGYGAGEVSPTLRAAPNGEAAVCFQQNQRCEVRLLGGDGSLAGALPAEPGSKCQNCLCYAVRTAMTGANGCGFSEGAAHALDTTGPEAVCYPEVCCLNPWDPQSKRVYSPGGLAPSMTASPGCGSGANMPVVIDRAASNQGANAKYDPCMEQSETMPTIVARGPHAVSYPAENSLTPWEGQARRVYGTDGCSPTLAARKGSGQDQQSVCAPAREPQWWEGEWRDFRYVLRRLTPVECERLQGFPDGWTDIPGDHLVIDWSKCPDEFDDPEGFAAFMERPEMKNVKTSDTARYKALGNSMAVPVMRWIGERMEEVA